MHKKDQKRRHKLDDIIRRLFKRYYSEDQATKDANYVAEVLNGLAARVDGNQDDTLRVLIPGTVGDTPREAALKTVQDALEKRGTRVLLEAVGDLAQDSDAVGALQGHPVYCSFGAFLTRRIKSYANSRSAHRLCQTYRASLKPM